MSAAPNNTYLTKRQIIFRCVDSAFPHLYCLRSSFKLSNICRSWKNKRVAFISIHGVDGGKYIRVYAMYIIDWLKVYSWSVAVLHCTMAKATAVGSSLQLVCCCFTLYHGQGYCSRVRSTAGLLLFYTIPWSGLQLVCCCFTLYHGQGYCSRVKQFAINLCTPLFSGWPCDIALWQLWLAFSKHIIYNCLLVWVWYFRSLCICRVIEWLTPLM